jgi:NADH dehydrogenase [ubiquinone] 1 alpha subcomplex assembly factor 2
MMKQLAARADERWRSVPSYLDSPNRSQALPALQSADPAGYAPQTEPGHHDGVTNAVEDPVRAEEGSQGKDTKEVDEGRFKGRTREGQREEAPWAKNVPKGAPSENWQPEPWTPGVAQRR